MFINKNIIKPTKKMSFEDKIKEWVILDNQMKSLNDKLKDLREKKSSVNEQIQNYATNNHLQNHTIQIGDGKLKITETRTAEPLTFKYLEKCLNEVITNKDQVSQIIQYIKQNREIKLVKDIKRFS